MELPVLSELTRYTNKSARPASQKKNEHESVEDTTVCYPFTYLYCCTHVGGFVLLYRLGCRNSTDSGTEQVGYMFQIGEEAIDWQTKRTKTSTRLLELPSHFKSGARVEEWVSAGVHSTLNQGSNRELISAPKQTIYQVCNNGSTEDEATGMAFSRTGNFWNHHTLRVVLGSAIRGCSSLAFLYRSSAVRLADFYNTVLLQ